MKHYKEYLSCINNKPICLSPKIILTIDYLKFFLEDPTKKSWWSLLTGFIFSASSNGTKVKKESKMHLRCSLYLCTYVYNEDLNTRNLITGYIWLPKSSIWMVNQSTDHSNSEEFSPLFEMCNIWWSHTLLPFEYRTYLFFKSPL